MEEIKGIFASPSGGTIHAKKEQKTKKTQLHLCNRIDIDITWRRNRFSTVLGG